MSNFNPTVAELTLSLEGSAVGSLANNLTTTVEGYALDARQGYALDQKKLDKAHVANNLVTTQEGYALDARQGKYLEDTKVGYTEMSKAISKAIETAQIEAKKTATITLPANSWAGSGPYTQLVVLSGVTDTDIVIVAADPSSYEAYVEALVRCSGQSENSLTFTATEKPTVALTVNVLLLK